MSESRVPGQQPVRTPGQRSCGGGCLRSVIGFAIIIGLILLVQPLRAQIQARLESPDYATGILTVSGGLALDFMAGVLLAGIMSAVAFGTRQTGFGTGSALLALVFLIIALSIGMQTWLDVISGPATVRGTVAYHFVDSKRGHTSYYLKLNAAAYPTTRVAYGQVVEGHCGILTYGARTKVVTAIAPCGP